MLTKLKELTFGKPKQSIPSIVKKSSLPKGAYPFLTAEELLRPHHRYMKAIRDDCEATGEYYLNYFLPAINRYVEIIQLRPYGQDKGSEFYTVGGAVELTIKRVAMTLKLRKGLLLPQNEHPESISKKAALWTYGAFTAALLREMGGQLLSIDLIGFDKKDKEQGIWKGWSDSLNKYEYYKIKPSTSVTRSLSQTASCMQLPLVLPLKGIEWLHEDLKLLDCVLDLLSGGRRIENNPLTDLVMEASNAIREANLVLEGQTAIQSPLNMPEGEMLDTSTGEVVSASPKKSEHKKPSTKSPSEQKMDLEQAILDMQDEMPTMEPLEPTYEEVQPVRNEKSYTIKTLSKLIISDLESGNIDPKEAWLLDDVLHILYPQTLKHYSDSPSDLFNELKLNGYVTGEKGRLKGGTNKIITLRK